MTDSEKIAELEKNQAVLEREQKYLSNEMRELSASIDKLTIAVNGILQKGSNNWDKLVWLVIGAVVPYMLTMMMKG